MYHKFLPLILLLLVGCSSNSSYFLPRPSKPDLILEGNGWHSTFILPQKDIQGNEIPFNKIPIDSPGLDIKVERVTPKLDGEGFLVFTSYNYRNSTHYWVYSVNNNNQLVSEVQLPSQEVEKYNSIYLAQVPDDPSIYWYGNKTTGYSEEDRMEIFIGGFYKNTTLISSHKALKTERSFDIELDVNKNILIGGNVYFEWASKSWRYIEALRLDDSYYFDRIDDANSNILFNTVTRVGPKNQLTVAFREFDLNTNQSRETPPYHFPLSLKYSPNTTIGSVDRKDKRYILYLNTNSRIASIVAYSKQLETYTVLVESVQLPASSSKDGYFVITDDEQIFYASPDSDGSGLITQIYKLDNTMKLVEISPTKVIADSVCIGIFTAGNKFYAAYQALIPRSRVASTHYIDKVSQFVYYE